MTVYVDNFRTPATVGGVRGRWSHLTADSPTELHTFAEKIGLKPEWFQACCKYGSCPIRDNVCAHFHFDVVGSKRAEAIRAGAVSIDIREMGALTSARRPYYRGEVSSVADKWTREQIDFKRLMEAEATLAGIKGTFGRVAAGEVSRDIAWDVISTSLAEYEARLQAFRDSTPDGESRD